MSLQQYSNNQSNQLVHSGQGRVIVQRKIYVGPIGTVRTTTTVTPSTIYEHVVASNSSEYLEQQTTVYR